MNENKIIILAGSKREFDNYLHNLKPEDLYGNYPKEKFIYGHSFQTVQSVKAEDVLSIGTFYERNDFHELRELAYSRIIPNKTHQHSGFGTTGCSCE